MNLVRQLRFKNVPIALFTFQLTVMALFERIDPDPFHSGFVYSQSIAVSEGLLPNKNFLSPYGIVGPLLNGLWLNLVNNSLLSLLIFYALITVSSCYLMSKEISRITNPVIGNLIGTVWVFSLGSAMPWPSLLTTFLTLLSITCVIRNQDKIFNDSDLKHRYLIPVVTFLDFAILTRIHLAITPLLISLYIFIKRKSLNQSFVKTWFLLQVLIGFLIILVLQFIGVLQPYIEQAVVWPLTSFEKPPINLSFLFSFIWFPVALLLIIFITFFTKMLYERSLNKYRRILSAFPSLFIFVILYYLSKYEFADSDVSTVKTLPGLIKTASVNLQFIASYAAGAAAFLGFIVLVLRKRSRGTWISSRVHEFEFWLMTSLAVTGMIQLYPLHDNVHLWFVTPLLLLPAVYYFKLIVTNFHRFFKPFGTVLVSVLVIQLFSFGSNLALPRVPLKSSELQGMMASIEYRDTTDRTMDLLDRYVTSRNLRNNCKAGLFSVAGRKYRSIDGNFSDNFFGLFATNTPTVDPTTRNPDLVFECGITSQERDEIIDIGFDVVFEVSNSVIASHGQELYNVLFRRRDSTIE